MAKIFKLQSKCHSATDPKCATEEKRVIITHDLDFSNISVYPPENYSGIIVLRISPPLANTILEALVNLFITLKIEEFNKRLIILEPNGFRIREGGKLDL